jgi:hypothetical protein
VLSTRLDLNLYSTNSSTLRVLWPPHLPGLTSNSSAPQYDAILYSCALKGSLSLSAFHFYREKNRTAISHGASFRLRSSIFIWETLYISTLLLWCVCVCVLSLFYVTSQQQQQRFLLGWTRLVQLGDTRGMCATRIFILFIYFIFIHFFFFVVLFEREREDRVFFCIKFPFVLGDSLSVGFTPSLTHSLHCV